ncbi:MAG: hypothetical protein AMXMBFR66_13240 [Pseudomonadota bacterium]|nr:PEPxxWA-CTERM sorting domain-containing protein [Rubrivivax sp.]
MKHAFQGSAGLAVALLLSVASGAAQAAWVENFDGTSTNSGHLPGQAITGSDFQVVQGLAYDFAKGASTDRYVVLSIDTTYGQGPTGTIKSTTLFNLVAGTPYKLSFDFSPTSGAPGYGPFTWNLTASIGGYTTTVDGSSSFGAQLDWRPVALFFTPSSNANLVPIYFAVASTFTQYVSAPIDNVRFEALPVPEPGAWAMLLAGLALTGVAVRRKPA